MVGNKFILRLNAVLAAVILVTLSSLASAQPADPYIIDLYNTYCKACHASEGTGAPQAFNQKEWKLRLQKSHAVVVRNAIVGIGNMPAQGGCQECIYEDFEALIDYMLSPVEGSQ